MKKKLFVTVICVIAVIACCTLMLVSCDKAEELYKPTEVKYDGVRLTWNRVELAAHYTVSIDGGEEKRVNTNMYNFDAQGKEFDVTINSVIKNKSYGDTWHFTPLDTIEQINIADNGELSWQEVPGATAYRISINGNVWEKDLTEPHYAPAAGSNRIKVRAVVSGDDTYYSFWSEEVSFSVNSTPYNIKYDGDVLSWTGNATQYEVNINGEKQIVSGSQLKFASQNRDFEVEIKALGDHKSTFDSTVAKDTYHYLAPVTNLNVEDGILHWDEIDGAEGYQIRVNNVVQGTVKTAEYSHLSVGVQLAVEVKPFNNNGNYFSTWSVVKNIYILETPRVRWNSDLELDGNSANNYIWDLVNGASGYTVSVERNGVTTTESLGGTISSFGYAYSEVGVYKLRVKAVADSVNTDYCDSKYSDVLTVERLAAPTLTSIISDPNNVSAGFTVNYQGVSGARGYQLYKNGTLLEGKYSTVQSISDSDVVDDSVSTVQNYTYMIRSMGEVRTINRQIYVTLPCLTASALSFNITVLAMPADLDMDGFYASWTAVSGANDYAVKYSGSTYTASQTRYDLSTLRAGSYDVSVCARGNGSATLPSNYTATINIQRLAAPTNIRISYGEGDGLLEFDKPTNAKSYEVYYGENRQAIPEEAWDNMYQFVNEDGTTLSTVAVANYWNDRQTIYYMTSEASPTQQFVRLAAPKFPEAPFANSVELVWNAPSNINTQEYTPTYQVWENGTMQTGGVQNGTRYTIQYLEGGANYVFTVKAVGNDTKYLDSEMSVPVPVYKLLTPSMRLEDGEYRWDGVANATAYIMEIDSIRVSNELHVSGNDYGYKPNYISIGKHTVRLYAVGDGGYSTINSDVYTYTQIVDACLAPEISFKYTHEQVTNGGAIEVKITTPSAHCSKYLYEIGGESITSSELTCSKQMESAGTYSVKVKALGGTFDDNQVYYIDSQFAGGGTGDNITLLAPPTVGSFSFNSDGVFKWATISGALGYDYQISYDGAEYTQQKHISAAALDPIENYKQYKTIKIKVRATGNGEKVISSAWVEYTWTNPNK